MNNDIQDEINMELLNYCDRLERQNKEHEKKLDILLEILTEVAERITK